MKITGLSPPDHFDGTVPKELLRTGAGEKKRQPERSEGPDVSFPIDEEDYSSDELSEIADRLRGLGYLE